MTNAYAVEATHTYTGPSGTVFTARLTVLNTSTGLSGSKEYFVAIRDRMLDVEVNVAIDQGLWYLHKSMTRFDCAAAKPCGYWRSGFPVGSGYHANDAANVNAFLVNGHVEGGNPDNPYVETVQRGVRTLFTYLGSSALAPQTNPVGTFSPDFNGNGIGLYIPQTHPFYQGGPVIDAIVATGTPSRIEGDSPGELSALMLETEMAVFEWALVKTNGEVAYGRGEVEMAVYRISMPLPVHAVDWGARTCLDYVFNSLGRDP